jgi:transposase
MKYKQNFKIMQITDKTMVVGVDIAKKKYFARVFVNDKIQLTVFDWRGIELDKVISFKPDWNGFNKFLDWVNEVAKRTDKEKIVVGFEPTGHYWFTFV